MRGGHLFAAMLFSVVERKANNAVGAGNRNRFNGNARIGTNHACALSSTKIDEALRFGRAFFEFDASIEVFRILANNKEVDIFVAPARTGNREHRAKIHVQNERFAKRDIHAAEARAHRGGNRAFDGDFIALHSLDGRFRQWRAASLFHNRGASFGNFPFDIGASRLNNALHSGRSFDSNAITWDERNSMLCHDEHLSIIARPQKTSAAHNLRFASLAIIPCLCCTSINCAEASMSGARSQTGHFESPFKKRLQKQTRHPEECLAGIYERFSTI